MTTTPTHEWTLDDLTRAIQSPHLEPEQREELLKLAFATPETGRMLAEVIGYDEFADVYFSDRVSRPHPGPQTRLMFEDADEILYGGARGGGKSYGFLLHFLEHALTWGHMARGIIFRRRFVDLESLIEDSFRVFGPIGGRFFVGGGRPHWYIPGGGILRFRYLEKEKHAALYQGHAYTWIGIEEAGTYSSYNPIQMLRGCLRSAFGVPVRLLLNANPGGIGHSWLKQRYVDPAPPGQHMIERMEDLAGEVREWRRVFIPAKVTDNPSLMLNDPQYVARLQMIRPEWLRRAWLSGDWNIVPAGGMFDDILSEEGLAKVALAPFDIPAGWRVYRALDWGSAKPFSVGWWAVTDGNDVTTRDGRTLTFPKKTLIRVAEWYGTAGDADNPNKGCGLLAAKVAREIQKRERRMFPDRQVHPGPADTQIYAEEGHERSIADEMRDPDATGKNDGVRWIKANKGPGSRVNGWEALRRVLTNAIEHPHEKPGMFVFDTCRHWLRSVPVLPRDSLDPEDVDSDAEDHIADETRYMLTTTRPTIEETRAPF